MFILYILINKFVVCIYAAIIASIDVNNYLKLLADCDYNLWHHEASFQYRLSLKIFRFQQCLIFSFHLHFYIKCTYISRLLQIMNKMHMDTNCNK